MSRNVDLKEMKVVDLRKLAQKRKVHGYYKMRKEELVEALSDESESVIEYEDISEIINTMNSNPKIHQLRKIAKKMGISFQRKIKKNELILRINREISKKKTWEVVDLKNYSSPGGEKVNFNKENKTENIPELKKTYLKDKIVALAVNPEFLYFYWDFSNQTKKLMEEVISKNLKTYLRVYDVTYIIFNRNNAHTSWDYEIGKGLKDYYVHVPFANASYIAEIGYINENGLFIPLLRSNSAHTPQNSFSERSEEKWLELESGFKLSCTSKGILSKPKVDNIGISSAEFGKMNEKDIKIISGGGSFMRKEGGENK